jgi:hypothetical protein
MCVLVFCAIQIELFPFMYPMICATDASAALENFVCYPQMGFFDSIVRFALKNGRRQSRPSGLKSAGNGLMRRSK